MARQGCEQIVLADDSLRDLQACRDKVLVQFPSARVHIEVFDQSSEDDVDRLFAAVLEQFPRIDFAINVVCQMQSQSNQAPQPTALNIAQYDRNFAVYQKGVRLKHRPAINVFQLTLV